MKKLRKTKLTACLAMATTFVVGSMPIMVFAEEIENGETPIVGEVVSTSLNDLIMAAVDGQVIVLDKDYSENIVIPADKNVVIDLNGFNLTGNGSHTIYNLGTLVIKGNGEVTNTTHNMAPIFNEGNLTIDGGVYKRVNNGNTNSFYVILNHGELTINDGEFSIDGGISSLIDNGWYTPADNTDGKIAELTINGGTFNIVNNNKYIKNDDFGVMTVNGGDFNIGEASAVIANIGSASGDEKISITGGNFTYAGTNYVVWDYIKVATGTETVDVTGGKFVTTNEQAKGVTNVELNGNFVTETDADGNAVVKLKSADYALLNEAIVKYKALDRTLYSEESLALLDEVVEAVAYDLTINEQEKVDDLAKDIEGKILTLQLKIVVKTPETPATLDAVSTSILVGALSMIALVGTGMYLRKSKNN